MKILILGHNGLLGNMVHKYFKNKNKYDIITTNLRWDNDDFKNFIKKQKIDYIINCIGIIPQRNPNEKFYDSVNYDLPVWLDSLGVKIIQSDTDENDSTPYGLSKKKAREMVNKNTKMIKSSIIGFEKNKKYSFLEWFLNSETSISGYTNQYWNGITTLEWSKWCEEIINNWVRYKHITILRNPECQSKYNILILVKKLFQKDIEIIPKKLEVKKDTCLDKGFITNDIMLQLIEMKYFYENI